MYKEIITQDKSVTFFNEEVKDYYHSQIGAMKEAIEKYSVFVENDCNIIDFCFGLGYNTLAAIKKANDKKLKLKIIALENDEEIMKKIKEIKLPEEYADFEDAKRIVEKLVADGFYKDDSFDLKLILGDAKETINQMDDETADLVFFDAFSPKKQPELWTKEMFEKVYARLKIGGKLLTYSSSKEVRAILKDAGFLILDGPIVGRKAPMTITIK